MKAGIIWTMLTTLVAAGIGIFVFLYLFWKRLKEDYSSEMIFGASFLVLTGLALGLIVSRFFASRLWFWTGLLGVGLGTAVGILKFRLRIFEVIEALAFSLLPWVGLTFVSDSISHASLSSFIGFVVCAALLALFAYFDRHYKNFSWYASGRVGFSGLTILGIFFSLRALVAIFFPFVLSFVGKYEALISGIAAFSFYFLVLNLARKVI